MLSYLFLAYWIQQLMTVNKAAVFNKQKNGPALRLLFIFLVIMTSSNGFHLCSGCFICNYSNPFAFLFSSFFLLCFCTQQFWSWEMRKLKLRESTSLAKVSLSGTNTVSCDHIYRTLQNSTGEVGSMEGQVQVRGIPGVHIVQGMLCRWSKAVNLVDMTMGSPCSLSPGTA